MNTMNMMTDDDNDDDNWLQSCYQMCAAVLWWRHLVNAYCEVNAGLIGLLAKLGAVCFWQPSVLNLIDAAVLHDSVCAVSLLPCVADCYIHTLGLCL